MGLEINPWVLYYHSTTDKDWTKKSYQKIWEFHTVEEFWQFFNNFNYLHDGMFFFMRQNVFPLWEEPENINGGSWSIKLSRKMTNDWWQELMMSLIGEYFTDTYLKDINGISITPKPNSSLIKIWHGNSKLKDKISFQNKEKYMYKKFKRR